MPKVKWGRNRDAEENEKISRELLAFQALVGKRTQQEMADAIGMDRRTWSNRLRDPSTFTIREIRRLRDIARSKGVKMPDFINGGAA